MAINLVELVQGYFTGPITRQISGLLGESEVATQSAIGVAVPAVIAGLMKQASTPGGANALSSSLDKIDTGFLGNLGASLGGGTKLLDMGSGFVKNLFGSNLGPVSDGISRSSGISKGAVSTLLGMIVPVVMGLVAKQKRTQGLDTSGLTSLLGEQKSFLSDALPSGIGEALGLGGLVGAARDVERAAYDAAYDTGVSAASTARDVGRSAYETSSRVVASTVGRAGYEVEHHGTSLFRKILPLLLIGALGLVAWSIYNSRDRTDVARAATSQLETTNRQVTSVFENATAALSSVKDEASARAALPKLEEAARGVTALSSNLQTMPESARDGVAQVVRNMQPNLQSLADKTLAIPGVRGVLEPVLKQLMDGIARLRA